MQDCMGRQVTSNKWKDNAVHDSEAWRFFYAQAPAWKSAADAAPGPRGRTGGKTAPARCIRQPLPPALCLQNEFPLLRFLSFC